MTIKSTRIFLIVLFIINTISAQDFQGIATYKSHRKVDLKMGDDTINSERQKQIQEQLKKQFQQEYTLKFTQYESVYKRNEKLEAPSPSSSGIRINVTQGADIMYKNVKENRYTNNTEIFGKLFLIKDSLSNRKWKLVNETKNIGEYTCYKATFNDTYETQSISDKGEIEIVKKERVTTAWYTPQIPVSNGPTDYYGLPGLILEINDDELTLVCTKIVLNPKESFKISEPKKGKEVTQKMYDEILDKKSKEMMESFKSRRGDGERVMIRMGG
ncbi:GLPGLI family protein [Flavivirga jejuensis]|uniref:GLPGLI family protein n=1 Tax=Flavivirga jejuensis TaxID=870487 RepID=A0ABT8WIU9_9FLAO|nr:GLPGLI family protein [Flavivirga jejuensis]MDO5972998.1 GLPGLI family protein [Flavivirga jejuensis]